METKKSTMTDSTNRLFIVVLPETQIINPGRLTPVPPPIRVRRTTMKRMLALGVAMLFAAGTAMAFHCPKDMKAIDDALAKNPKLTAAQMKEVKAHRAKGEELHKAGKHQESIDELDKAKKILNVKDA